jgi:hypothetical protein
VLLNELRRVSAAEADQAQPIEQMQAAGRGHSVQMAGDPHRQCILRWRMGRPREGLPRCEQARALAERALAVLSALDVGFGERTFRWEKSWLLARAHNLAGQAAAAEAAARAAVAEAAAPALDAARPSAPGTRSRMGDVRPRWGGA